MTMKLVARCLFLASALLMIPSTTIAQDTGVGGFPAGAGRNTDLEFLDRGFDVLGVTPPGMPPGYWNTEEGKARFEQLQLQRFAENVEELSEIEKEDWTAQYDSISDRRTRRDFEDRAEDLEKITDGIIKFFEWRFDAEPIEVDEPSEESLRDGVVEITPMVTQILESIETLQSGGIEVQTFVEMRENLAQIHALTRVLRD